VSFGDAYLLKAGLRELLIETEPHPGLKIIVTIPVYNESGLERCLDSLFKCHTSPQLQVEVLILINAPADAPEAVLEQNRATCNAAWKWIGRHPHPQVTFHFYLDHSFPENEAGVGLARKILMDEAVRRFGVVGNPDGIIASLDADAVVEKNYLMAIAEHFHCAQSQSKTGEAIKRDLPDGCSIYFEHPLDEETTARLLSGESYGSEIFEAIIQYELHLRYYLQSVRSTGYPYAFHTVGSSFAVKADIYCKEGGMNRRQGGEDFYFIQKVAQRGNYSECNTTRVIPSPRPSERVPFGTGPVVIRLSKDNQRLSTYNPQPFLILKKLFSGLEIMYSEASQDHFMKSLPEVLLDFLQENRFEEALLEIRKNSASLPAFRKRFWRWFNMFRIMKFLHHARETGYPDFPVGEASLKLLKQIKPEGVEIPSDEVETPSDGVDLKKLLLIYRKLDRVVTL